MSETNIKRLALLVGGGPAPGINGVISAVTIEAINQGAEVFGIRDGYKWLIEGDEPQMSRLSVDDVRAIHLRGGSVLGTARANPTKKPEDLQKVLKIFNERGIDSLVSIGGDDTAYSASQVYKASGGSIRVAHVPKTIDNDLPLHASTPTFGFETARQVGTMILRNMAEDARTTSRWYLIVSMGRAAGHLALGIGKASAATLTIIPEEFRGRQVTADEVCDIIIGSIIKRQSRGRRFGVVMLAEGLLESIGAEGLAELMGDNINRYGKVTRDPHGHLRLGEIDFGRLIKDLLNERLEKLGLKITFIDKDLGYELRCADPIPFDAEYTRDLGYGAVKFLRSPQAAEFGAIISYVEGRMEPLPFESKIDPETKRMRTRIVDVNGEGYECARRYMIRLEKEDFVPEKIAEYAKVTNLTPEQFQERFGYLGAD
ncbi:MAG: diphosphate--fructose-6-phosphate 1-phosphotransferase [Gemmataceae bacterium]